jgi:hypothetical protein
MESTKFLNINEASAILGITPKGLRKIVSSRKIKFYRLSDSERGRIRFLEKDLVDYMQSLSVGTVPEMTPALQAKLIRELV